MKTKVIYIAVLSQLFILSVCAQPSWVKKANKSVFSLKTFAADGSLSGSTTGFFIGERGEAVSSLAPFKGAVRAVAIDASGKELPVLCMLGANDTYDIAKFRVDAKKTVPFVLATDEAIGSTAWLLPYRELKHLPNGTILNKETVMSSYNYYTVAMSMPEQSAGAPLLNEQGEVIGIMQQSASATDTVSYAVSATMADSLKINGLSINDPTLRSIGIKKDLPDQLDQANLTMFVASSALDSANYAQLIEDFIQKFPNAYDGYVYRAQFEGNAGHFDAADRDMQQAVRLSEKKDEAHFAYSKLIFQKELYMSNMPYTEWSLDKALSEIQEACRLNPLPVYRHHEASILYAQKKYDQACQIYEELAQSDLRSASIFYEAARCKELLNDTTAQLALLDSALATYSRPYLKEAAPYIFARAQARLKAKKYRDAVSDLNDYEQLMAANVNANFYYLRHQAELTGRMYQLALNDINRAIQMQPDNDLYYAEKASLEIRVGYYDDAIKTAQECIRLAPQQSDGYLFLGVAQCVKGMKEDGLKNLKKAQELGEEQAAALIEKYSK